eukprot:scaffold20210_cov113-Isochrysis_galbana.AAC.3
MGDYPAALALVCPLEDAAARRGQLAPQAGHVGTELHRPACEEAPDCWAKVGAVALGERLQAAQELGHVASRQPRGEQGDKAVEPAVVHCQQRVTRSSSSTRGSGRAAGGDDETDEKGVPAAAGGAGADSADRLPVCAAGGGVGHAAEKTLLALLAPLRPLLLECVHHRLRARQQLALRLPSVGSDQTAAPTHEVLGHAEPVPVIEDLLDLGGGLGQNGRVTGRPETRCAAGAPSGTKYWPCEEGPATGGGGAQIVLFSLLKTKHALASSQALVLSSRSMARLFLLLLAVLASAMGFQAPLLSRAPAVARSAPRAAPVEMGRGESARPSPPAASVARSAALECHHREPGHDVLVDP